MSRCRPFVTTLVALTIACQRDPKPPLDRPDHAMLRGLRPPPTNAPLRQPPDSQKAGPLGMPQGTASTLMVLRGGQPFTGALEIVGRLRVTADRISLEPAGDRAIELLYRLPPGMPALRSDSGMGSLALVERSDPAHAWRQVVLRSGGRILLAETWRVAQKPLQLELGNALRLVQQDVRPSPESRYTEAPLDAMEGSRVIARIPIGRPTVIPAASGRWVVFSEVSHLLTATEAELGQVEGGYILRCWVVPGD